MLGSVQAHSAHEVQGATDLPIQHPTAGQRYAASALREAMEQKQPLVVVFGDSGSGKTTLINGVLETTDQKQFAILNFSATSGEFSNVPTFDDLMQAACRRLDAVQRTHGRPETLAVLSAAVGELARKGQTLLLAIDHADHLTVDAIAEIIKLPDYLDIPQNNLVRIFVGSMSLASRLDSVLRHLGINQRLSEIRLSQPSAEEVAALIAYEDSTQAGGPMLTPGAIERIIAYAKSNLHWAVPMADAARILAESAGNSKVTAELVRSALLDIWSPEEILSNDPRHSEGLSDSVSRSPGLEEGQDADFPRDFPSDQALASDSTKRTRVVSRRLKERAAPVAAITLFLIGTVVLALRDSRLEVVSPQTEPAMEAARQLDPTVPSPDTIPKESKASEQLDHVDSVSAIASGEGSLDAADATKDVGPAVLPREHDEAETAEADSKSLMYGPWPNSAADAHRNEPVMPQNAGTEPSEKEPAVEKPAKATAPPKKKKAILLPAEPRPDDLTSHHWIQKR